MSGVGTEIAKQIPSWAARQETGCGCNDRKRKWDKWGWRRCEKRRDMLIASLVSQQQYLTPPLNKLPKAALSLAAGRIVDKAIARVKEHEN